MKNKNVVVAVSGGIAAYKSAELVSRLKKQGCNVKCVMTKHATEFITPLTLETLSGNAVVSDMFEKHNFEVEHIALAKWADVFVIAPATANVIGKISAGIADDFLTTAVMATKASVFFAPAMNDAMYENPILQRNIAFLKELGYYFIEPVVGNLACGTVGKGKMAEPEVICEVIANFSEQDLKGKRFLITAGPTKEKIDPVRYITNHSSGKMGYAVAKRAYARGADVVLVSTKLNIPVPYGVKHIEVTSAQEMYQVVTEEYSACDAMIKTAAVADYRPIEYTNKKIKKSDGDWTLTLTRNPDILAKLGQEKKKQILVGFAAETDHLEMYALDKLKRKNLDLIVANDLTEAHSGFGKDTNLVTIYSKEGEKMELPLLSKDEVADILLDQIKVRFQEDATEQ